MLFQKRPKFTQEQSFIFNLLGKNKKGWGRINNQMIINYPAFYNFSSVQFSHSVVSDSLRPHESQHASPPCPSQTLGVHSDSCPSSQWCHPTLCDPMNRSTPALPVHHKLSEFTQTHVHRVSDAIQPSHPLSSPFPPAPNPSPHQTLFQWVNSSHKMAKVLEFQLQHHSHQRNPRADFFQNGLVGSLQKNVNLTPKFKPWEFWVAEKPHFFQVV